ncbi:hypothetical protein LJR164_002664 [Phenylobacterium sp. LjRoot164]|uniref:hypothetical protein n=1 Tax=unclassified Phenylobacterium TaxID=2640670 RepID=UPI003ECFF90C
MLKHLPATLTFALAMAASASPAAGGQDAAASAARAAEASLIWTAMILGFVSAGALLRHDRRARRVQVLTA